MNAARSTASASDTSTGIASARRPRLSTSARALSSASPLRASSATSAPLRANSRAAALPTPALAPVTTTTLLLRLWSISYEPQFANARARSRFRRAQPVADPVPPRERGLQRELTPRGRPEPVRSARAEQSAAAYELERDPFRHSDGVAAPLP